MSNISIMLLMEFRRVQNGSAESHDSIAESGDGLAESGDSLAESGNGLTESCESRDGLMMALLNHASPVMVS